MDLERQLSRSLLEKYPEEAARVLEALAPQDGVAVLGTADAEHAAAVLRVASPHFSAATLARLDLDKAARVVARLPLDHAALLLRRLDDGLVEKLLGDLPERTQRSLRANLRFAVGTAGALMDPRVVALPGSLSADQGLRQIREDPEHVLYNLYVIDAEQVLVGVLNLRELLLARKQAPLSSVMHPPRLRLLADADRRTVATHPGWRQVHSLPVVDARGHFLGAIRFRTLRQLEDELRQGEFVAETQTAHVLGDLFWTGLAGLIDGMSGGSWESDAPSRERS